METYSFIDPSYREYLTTSNTPYYSFKWTLLNFKSNLKSMVNQAYRFYNNQHFINHYLAILFTINKIPNEDLFELVKPDVHFPIGDFCYWGLYFLKELGDNEVINTSVATCLSNIFNTNTKTNGIFYQQKLSKTVFVEQIHQHVINGCTRFYKYFKSTISLQSFVNKVGEQIQYKEVLNIAAQNEVTILFIYTYIYIYVDLNVYLH